MPRFALKTQLKPYMFKKRRNGRRIHGSLRPVRLHTFECPNVKELFIDESPHGRKKGREREEGGKKHMSITSSIDLAVESNTHTHIHP